MANLQPSGVHIRICGRKIIHGYAEFFGDSRQSIPALDSISLLLYGPCEHIFQDFFLILDIADLCIDLDYFNLFFKSYRLVLNGVAALHICILNIFQYLLCAFLAVEDGFLLPAGNDGVGGSVHVPQICKLVQDIFLAVQLKVKSHDFAEADILFLIYGNFSAIGICKLVPYGIDDIVHIFLVLNYAQNLVVVHVFISRDMPDYQGDRSCHNGHPGHASKQQTFVGLAPVSGLPLLLNKGIEIALSPVEKLVHKTVGSIHGSGHFV